jgi:hypothetical protein
MFGKLMFPRRMLTCHCQIMEICYKCGVKVVTVYAFSIENFNRPKYEVEGLMQLAKVKLEQLTKYGHILDRYGARVRVLGQRELIRADVLAEVDKAVARTKHNNKFVSNIGGNGSMLANGQQGGAEYLLSIHFSSRDDYSSQVDRARIPRPYSSEDYTLFAL